MPLIPLEIFAVGLHDRRKTFAKKCYERESNDSPTASIDERKLLNECPQQGKQNEEEASLHRSDSFEVIKNTKVEGNHDIFRLFRCAEGGSLPKDISSQLERQRELMKWTDDILPPWTNEHRNPTEKYRNNPSTPDRRDTSEEGTHDTPSSTEIARAAIVAGMDFWAKSEFEESLKQFEKALLVRHNDYGMYDKDTMKIFFWIGLACWGLDDMDRALLVFRRTLRIGVVVWGPEHDTCNVIKKWIQKILHGKGMSQTYINVYQKALWDSISHQVKGVRCLLFEKGTEAYWEFYTALRLERSCNTPNDGATTDEAGIIAQIGDALMCLRRYEEASKNYSAALAIYQKNLDPTHPCIVKTFYKITHAARKVNYSRQAGKGFSSGGAFHKFRNRSSPEQRCNSPKRGATIDEGDVFSDALRYLKSSRGVWQKIFRDTFRPSK